MAVAIAIGAIILFIGFILAMMFTPIGWVLLGIGGLVLIIALATAGVRQRAATASVRKQRHGPEDLRRGSNDDPMLH